MGKSPSYYNISEVELVEKYIKTLVEVHHIDQDDIGVITPYIRQVYKIKLALNTHCYSRIEVGTVESFQGKEKRIIIISTVRANSLLLDYDVKYQLGFLVEDQRFNVALTRAKAKLVIIGNPLCLLKDVKWRKYIEKCKELDTYLGYDYESAVPDETKKENYEKLTGLLEKLKITFCNE